MLDLVRGFLLLVGIFLLGTFLHERGVPIPGSVLGLLLLYGALLSGMVKLSWVEKAAGLLLRHMVLLFVPVTVGLIDVGGVVSRSAIAIAASLLVSFLAVLLTTGMLGQRLLARKASAEHLS
ncbi:CidA/LrgA family protein [Acidobacteria bacterium AB60]|nr:CidA/LrgA family protein [Acidobacteria bacterium AB60]